MRKTNDLTGLKFGRLTVLQLVENDAQNSKKKRKKWLCQCDCGKQKIVLGDNLQNGKTQSCGCLHKEITVSKFSIDITGQVFGRLTAIKRIDNFSNDINSRHRTKWLCSCTCGKTTIVDLSHLRSGRTLSCGCYSAEKNSKLYLEDLIGKTFGKLTVIKRWHDYISCSGTHYVQWLCKCDCGNTKIILSTNLKQGYTLSCGCLNSKGECLVNKYLCEKHIDFKTQKTYNDLLGINNGKLSYDFYLPEYNLLVEIQGQQHEKPIDIFGGEEQFKIQQEHDRRKREYAEKNGYKLLEIWYYDYDKIEEILSRELEVV